MSKKVFGGFFFQSIIIFYGSISMAMKNFDYSILSDKKQFKLPDVEQLWPSPEEFFKQKMLSFTPKKSKPYHPLIQKINFGVDISDLVWNVKSWLKDGNDYFHQVNINPIGLFFRHGIYVGIDGGYAWITNKNNSGPFINISIGWEYFNIGLCRIFVGGAKVGPHYPLWWMITPLSKTFELLKINPSWGLNLHVEIFFKRLIFDANVPKIPFFGDINAFNIKKTYFGFRMYIEGIYTNIDDKISF